MRAENPGNTKNVTSLLGLPFRESTWFGEIDEGLRIRLNPVEFLPIESCLLNLFTTTEFFMLSQKLKGLKRENKTDLFLMNTSQNLTLPHCSRVKPNTMLVWGVDGEAVWASVFPSLSLFFLVFHFLVSLRKISPPYYSHPQTFELKTDFSLSWSWVLDAPERIFWEVWLSII